MDSGAVRNFVDRNVEDTGGPYPPPSANFFKADLTQVNRGQCHESIKAYALKICARNWEGS